MDRSPHHPPVPQWYVLRGRRPPTTLTRDQAWWSPPDRGRTRRRLASLARRTGPGLRPRPVASERGEPTCSTGGVA